MDRRILIVTSPEQAAARVQYPAVAGHANSMLKTFAASAAVDISQIGAELEVLPTGCHQGGLQVVDAKQTPIPGEGARIVADRNTRVQVE
jgi:hypothetical protein